ncbi:reverse transcriptase N-terminal domain-containing protein [Nostoc edaphicum]|uniref:reverse transcriptase N-terminal domain-containing protein n=1 Tax=Nostoc edaphicum TaxID=264686 RepID=UPI001EEA588B|nr:reverse transcriptase N-terminal domain-containing protein [Nostoc edaphicum]
MTSNSDSELWIKIPWKKLRKNLFRLQCRLWKAIREGDRKRANSLQKLISCYAAKFNKQHYLYF